jgi:hypothetical protein
VKKFVHGHFVFHVSFKKQNIVNAVNLLGTVLRYVMMLLGIYVIHSLFVIIANYLTLLNHSAVT